MGIHLGGGCSCVTAHIAYVVVIVISIFIIIVQLVFIYRRKRGKHGQSGSRFFSRSFHKGYFTLNVLNCVSLFLNYKDVEVEKAFSRRRSCS